MATKKIYTRIGHETFVTEIEVPEATPVENPKRRGRKPKAAEPSLDLAPTPATDEAP
ncbi:MAG: hypothetical protein RLZZ216_1467 [Cyanobacteriota bacterium]|jgi:hypothetical protein